MTSAFVPAVWVDFSRCDAAVVWIQLVDCEVPLDYADTSSAAALWTLGAEGQVQRSFEGEKDDAFSRVPKA